MKLLTPMAFSFAVVLAAGFSTCVCAQETDPTQVYLEEPEKEPPPKITRKETVEEKYEDEVLRIERGIALLSNDQFISHGKYVEYYHDGQKYTEGSHDMGVYVGQWKYWHPNDQICKTISFKAGKPHGTWDVFRPDGSRLATKTYENGLRHGTWVNYFENGEQPKVELTYEKGKMVGERLTYYANGQIRQQMPFENGLMHGMLINFSEDGKKVSEMAFDQGKAKGKPKRFD